MIFPITFDETGKTVTGDYDSLVKQGVLTRLLTSLNSVAFDRSFGSDKVRLIFETNDSVLESLLRYFIRESLQDENRISITEIEIDSQNGTKEVPIVVKYRLRELDLDDEVTFNFNREI